MLASLLIVFREVLEAGLIVGIVLAATRGIAARGAWIAGGIGAGVVGAGLVAVFAGALSDAFAGNGQEVFNAAVLLIAVVMLGWHNIWMARHGREVARQIQAMGHAVSRSVARSLLAVAVVVTVAVLREGAEVVLFLYGIAASSEEGWATLLAGGALGIGCGASAVVADLSRPARHPGRTAVRRHQLAGGAAGGRHGRAGGSAARQGRPHPELGFRRSGTPRG